MPLLYPLPLSLTINIDISKGQTAYSSIKPHVKGGLHHAKNRIHPVVHLPDRSVHRSVFQHLPFHQKYRGPLRTAAHRDHHIQNRFPAKFSHLASHEFHAVFSHAPGIAEPLSLPPSATRSLVQELRHRLLQRARLDGSTLVLLFSLLHILPQNLFLIPGFFLCALAVLSSSLQNSHRRYAAGRPFAGNSVLPTHSGGRHSAPAGSSHAKSSLLTKDRLLPLLIISSLLLAAGSLTEAALRLAALSPS